MDTSPKEMVAEASGRAGIVDGPPAARKRAMPMPGKKGAEFRAFSRAGRYGWDRAGPVARTRLGLSLPGRWVGMPVGHIQDIDDLAQRDELGDGPGQLQRLVVAELALEVRPEGVVHLVMILVHAVGVAERHLLALGERPALVVAQRGHELLGDPLAPSRGVAGGHSVVAAVPPRPPETNPVPEAAPLPPHPAQRE